MTTVHLELTPGQAAAVVSALDLYSRIGIGQLEEVASLVNQGVVPPHSEQGQERAPVDAETARAIEECMLAAKRLLGFHSSASRGIGHPHNDISTSRAYEVKKVLDLALAMHHDPNPSFRGVNYDGLIVRYTTDPAPVAEIRTGND